MKRQRFDPKQHILAIIAESHDGIERGHLWIAARMGLPAIEKALAELLSEGEIIAECDGGTTRFALAPAREPERQQPSAYAPSGFIPPVPLSRLMAGR